MEMFKGMAHISAEGFGTPLTGYIETHRKQMPVKGRGLTTFTTPLLETTRRLPPSLLFHPTSLPIPPTPFLPPLDLHLRTGHFPALS